MNDTASARSLLLAGAVLAVIILLNASATLTCARRLVGDRHGGQPLLAWAMDMLPADAPSGPGGDHYPHAALYGLGFD